MMSVTCICANPSGPKSIGMYETPLSFHQHTDAFFVLLFVFFGLVVPGFWRWGISL